MIFESTRFFNFPLTTRNSMIKCGHANRCDQKLTITLSARQVIIPFAGATERSYGNFGEGIARTKLR